MDHKSPASLQTDILEYYTSCETQRTNPFSVVVRKGTLAVDAVFYSLSSVSRLAKQLYPPAQVNVLSSTLVWQLLVHFMIRCMK